MGHGTNMNYTLIEQSSNTQKVLVITCDSYLITAMMPHMWHHCCVCVKHATHYFIYYNDIVKRVQYPTAMHACTIHNAYHCQFYAELNMPQFTNISTPMKFVLYMSV